MIDKEMILTQLVDRIKESGDQYWISKIEALSDSHLHVAVMVEPYITKIMKGEKTIESRFSQNKIVPWGRIFPGDIIIIKRSGGGFEAAFEAGEVISKELTSSSEVEQIKNDFNDRLCIENDWWEKKLKSRYVTLIPITHLLRFNSFVIKFKNRQAWLDLYQPKQINKELVSERVIGIERFSVVSKIAQAPVICISGKIGSGKTTIGKMLEEKLGKEFIDLDDMIIAKAGKSIPEIFQESGETGFRAIETEVAIEASKMNNKIIATGGGVVKHKVNMDFLRLNGITIFIDRDINKLISSDPNRPLSSSKQALQQMHKERYTLYQKYAAYIAVNNANIEETVDDIVNTYHSILIDAVAE